MKNATLYVFNSAQEAEEFSLQRIVDRSSSERFDMLMKLIRLLSVIKAGNVLGSDKPTDSYTRTSFQNSQFQLFLKTLFEEGVRYLVAGDLASTFHGLNRATDIIELYVEDTIENRKKLRAAFIKNEMGDFEPLERIEFIPGWTFFHLNNGFRLDIMTSLKGLENVSFDECFQMAVEVDIEGIPVRFLHYNHLIESKKAANRPKDQIDIIELEKIHNFTQKNSP